MEECQCVTDITRALVRSNKSGVYRPLDLGGAVSSAARRRAPIVSGLCEREETSGWIAPFDRYAGLQQSLYAYPPRVSPDLTRNGGCGGYCANEPDPRARGAVAALLVNLRLGRGK